jgi:hypothetical protein
MVVGNNGTIHVAWSKKNGSENYQFIVSTSINNGTSFDYNVMPYHWIQYNCQWDVDMAMGMNQELYVTWSGEVLINSSKVPVILFAKSVDCGKTFSNTTFVNKTISKPSPLLIRPTISIDSLNNIYIAWLDDRGNTSNVYVTKSTNQGDSFSNDVKVDDGPVGCNFPDISTSNNGTIYVTWTDARNKIPPNSNTDIYFSASYDNGSTFIANQRVDYNRNISTAEYYPSITLDKNGNIYIRWAHQEKNETGKFNITAIYVATNNPDTFVNSSLSGQILDSVTLLPIDGALISIGTNSTTSDIDGNFRLNDIFPNIYNITITKAGYKMKVVNNFTIEALQNYTGVTILLEPEGVPEGYIFIISSIAMIAIVIPVLKRKKTKE